MKQIVLKAQVNTKSDFDMILRLYATDVKDGERFDIGIPEYDWIAKFFTFSKTNCYVVSCIGGVKTNWYDDKGRIHVVFDNHKLLSGVLKVEFTFIVPDSTMPDGNRRTVEPQALEVQLVPGKTTIPSSFEAEIGIPWAFLHDTDAYNSILEKVNAEFDKILGQQPAPAPNGSVQRQYGQQTVTLTRGIIGINSRPGMVYRNTGYIKIPTNPNRYPLDLKEEIYFVSENFNDGGIPMNKVGMDKKFPIFTHFTSAAELNLATMTFPAETGDYIAGIGNLQRYVCRLSIPTGEGYGYLWRNPASGKIEVYKGQLGAVVEQPVPAPEIPDFGSKEELFCYLSSISANLEFMYLGSRSGLGRGRTTGWHRCNISRIKLVFSVRKRGLIKVRTSFPKKRRSRWETLSLGLKSYIRL